MNSFAKRLAAIAMLLGVWGSQAFAANAQPDVLVKQTIEGVLEVIREDERVKSGDVNRIAQIMEEKIAPHFDFPRMTRLAVGRPWRKATNDQRVSLVKEFRTLLIRSYASAFTMYKGIFVEYRPLRGGTDSGEVTVNTLIRLPGGVQPISVDYDMQQKEDGWKVFDVRIDGASLIINYRNMFSREIDHGGIEGLIESLAQKNSGGVSTATGSK